ncbi:hypothetical protein E4U21_004191 [Claviceps maximensis]|nr:hypothetical protein E4U21_004191 [Claviceps maximensis]
MQAGEILAGSLKAITLFEEDQEKNVLIPFGLPVPHDLGVLINKQVRGAAAGQWRGEGSKKFRPKYQQPQA